MDVQKAKLPPTVLGEERCFQIGHSFQEDIVARTWEGPLDGSADDNDKTNLKAFGLMHSTHVLIIAALMGYLSRLGRSKQEIRSYFPDEIIKTAIGNDTLQRHYSHLQSLELGEVSRGDERPWSDIPDQGLSALTDFVPNKPGGTNGTAFYTTRKDNGLFLVLAGLAEEKDMSIKITNQEWFVEEDVPIIGSLVYRLARGQCRDQIAAILK